MTDEILTIEEQYGRMALSYTQQFLQLCKTLDKNSHVLDLCCGYRRHALCSHEQALCSLMGNYADIGIIPQRL